MLSQDDLKQIGGIVREEIRAEVEPIKSDLREVKYYLAGVKNDVQEIRQGQTRLETIVEAEKL